MRWIDVDAMTVGGQRRENASLPFPADSRGFDLIWRKPRLPIRCADAEPDPMDRAGVTLLTLAACKLQARLPKTLVAISA